MVNEKNYRVIEILNSKEVLIDYGLKHNAKLKQKVLIYVPSGTVKDPDNEMDLKPFEVVKDELEIVYVLKEYSICRKLKRDLNPLIDSMSSILNPLTAIKIQAEELNVDKSQITNRKWKSNEPIRKGDKVMIVDSQI